MSEKMQHETCSRHPTLFRARNYDMSQIIPSHWPLIGHLKTYSCSLRRTDFFNSTLFSRHWINCNRLNPHQKGGFLTNIVITIAVLVDRSKRSVNQICAKGMNHPLLHTKNEPFVYIIFFIPGNLGMFPISPPHLVDILKKDT